ncbi:aminoglycoside phosphotransferase family protein [Thalassotalea profundi]|uniref:Cell wall phosphotransferase n=1 Tax=Thalassotalea profundi TaxID=2036687 RepID=A0ABQ3IR81_9GAMM|nr:phosphotransferase [Thalassotalea profundi]GHE92101.1 cell wall phosphotransferase [Thalassotalea profundi]
MIEDVRQSQLITWLSEVFSAKKIVLLAMNGDAGFRRYFRFKYKNQIFIAVDSPAQWCNNVAFNKIQHLLQEANIQVPQIIAENKSEGFFCLSDLGDTLLSDIVSLETMAFYYQQAIAILPKISKLPCESFPVFDESFIQTELNIFVEWLLNEHLAIVLTDQENFQLEQCFAVLIDNALSQPQVTMHRDYHSRNIMQTADKQLAIIDFQDAVRGPITYDIVSLLRDCYLKWPNENVSELLDHFIALQTVEHNLTGISKEQWQIWFDLMGLQRHIKASGIFARLYHRDNKTSYLKDIPLTLSYIVDISSQYDSLTFLAKLVSEKVLPKLAKLTSKPLNVVREYQ